MAFDAAEQLRNMEEQFKKTMESLEAQMRSKFMSHRLHTGVCDRCDRCDAIVNCRRDMIECLSAFDSIDRSDV